MTPQPCYWSLGRKIVNGLGAPRADCAGGATHIGGVASAVRTDGGTAVRVDKVSHAGAWGVMQLDIALVAVCQRRVTGLSLT
jgi:hypothetical protein